MNAQFDHSSPVQPNPAKKKKNKKKIQKFLNF